MAAASFTPRVVRTCAELGICQFRQPPCGPGTGCMHSPACADTSCPGRPDARSMPAGLLHTCNGGACGIEPAHAASTIPPDAMEIRPGFWFVPGPDDDGTDADNARSGLDDPRWIAAIAVMAMFSVFGLAQLVGLLTELGPDRLWSILIGGAR